MNQSHRCSRIARWLWAAPCSLVGLALASPLLLLGGKARYSSGAIEIALHRHLGQCGPRARALPFRAITFGHVIVAVTDQELVCHRRHEHVHVAQYERWGLFFFPAYLLSSAWQWLQGRDAYLDNVFEVEARALSRDG